MRRGSEDEPDGGVAIAQQVLQAAVAHGGAQVLTHGYKGQPYHRWALMMTLQQSASGIILSGKATAELS